MIIIRYILMIFQFILLARVLLSWFPDVDRSNQIIRFLYDVTEPVLEPIRNALRNVLPPNLPLDLSPLIVFFIISILLRLF